MKINFYQPGKKITLGGWDYLLGDDGNYYSRRVGTDKWYKNTEKTGLSNVLALFNPKLIKKTNSKFSVQTPTTNNTTKDLLQILWDNGFFLNIQDDYTKAVDGKNGKNTQAALQAAINSGNYEYTNGVLQKIKPKTFLEKSKEYFTKGEDGKNFWDNIIGESTNRELIDDLMKTIVGDDNLLDPNDPDYETKAIKRLQARYAIPVTGKLDEETLKMFKHKNSFLGRFSDFVQEIGSPGSAVNLGIVMGLKKFGINPVRRTIYREHFPEGSQRVFDNILKQAMTKYLGSDLKGFSIAGPAYTDGYAPGNIGYSSKSIIPKGWDTLMGNNLHSAGWSVGGGHVVVGNVNGKRIAMLIDSYDFKNEPAKYDASKGIFNQENMAAKLANTPATRTTLYAIDENGNQVSREEIEDLFELLKALTWDKSTPNLNPYIGQFKEDKTSYLKKPKYSAYYNKYLLGGKINDN